MKITRSLILLLLAAIAAYAQGKRITADEYDKSFQFAVAETNAAYPVILTIRKDQFQNGTIARSVVEVVEKQSEGFERIRKSVFQDGVLTEKYQLMVGFGNVYCSENGSTWKGPSPDTCPAPESVSGPRDPESVVCTVGEGSVAGEKVKIYQKHSVFFPTTLNGKKEFRDQVAWIDSKGFFINVVDSEGTLDPKSYSLTRLETWVTKAKIKPVVTPANFIRH